MVEGSILIIDDEPNIREVLVTALSREGYLVDGAGDGLEGIKKAESTFYDLVITDIRMPGMDGMQVLQKVLEIQPEMYVIIITAYATIENAVQAMKMGACDYIEKPFRLEEVKLIVERALKQRFFTQGYERLRREVERRYAFGNVIGRSLALVEILDKVEHIAKYDISVLILGPSGSGKEVIAKAIHYNSSRKNKPFIPLHCGAIPETLLEDELFGHMKGAFTGADASREGRFRQAEGGSLFLDEIASISPNLQVKLLRVLQEKEYSPLGTSTLLKTNARIIAATNVDLEQAVKDKTFREDLYYRLNVVTIKIPPLKERMEDIPLLATHFLKSACEQHCIKSKIISKAVIKQFLNYEWPGNVRELENLMHQLTIMTADKDIINLEDLPAGYRKSGRGLLLAPDLFNSGLSFDDAIDKYERYLIQEALRKCSGVKSKAAHLLKIKRTTLLEKIKRLEIQ